jgi:hypothetical protein
VRTITHEVTGIKPSGFYDPEEERRQALLLAAGEYPHIRSCFLESLEETVRDVLKTHRQTPLLLTGSDEMSAELVAWFNQQVRRGGCSLRAHLYDACLHGDLAAAVAGSTNTAS